jgi:hypothetical protein
VTYYKDEKKLKWLESLKVRRFEGFDCKESPWENSSTFQPLNLQTAFEGEDRQ